MLLTFKKEKKSSLFIQRRIPGFVVGSLEKEVLTQVFSKILKFHFFTPASHDFIKYLEQKFPRFYQNSQDQRQKSQDFSQHILRKKSKENSKWPQKFPRSWNKFPRLASTAAPQMELTDAKSICYFARYLIPLAYNYLSYNS